MTMFGAGGRCAAAYLLALASAPPAAAQEPDADIVVTGRGLADRPGDAAFDIVTIGRERIAANAAGRLESVLADVAGLQQFRRSDARSANPTSQGISLRGIGGNAASRALLLLDGVPQADPFGGWVPFPAYATDRLAAVRVTRGGGSGYLGAGALAGTVELESAGPGDAAPVIGAVSTGSRASLDARGGALLRTGGGFVSLAVAGARGDGFVPIVAADRGPADRRARYAQASGAVRVVTALDPTTELQASLAAFTDQRERGLRFTDNRSRGADASVRIVGRGTWGFAALGYLQRRNFASQFASVDAARTVAAPTLDQFATPATGLGARLELRPPVGRGGDLRLGTDLRVVHGRTREDFAFVAGNATRRRVAGGATRTLGLFVDASATRGAVTATLGGRVDGWRIADGMRREAAFADGTASERRFPARSGRETTGRAGIAVAATSAVTLRAAVYRGWRLPTLNELYRPFRLGADATAANAALRPERLDGADVGFALAPAPRVTVATTVFWNRLDGAIVNVAEGTGPGSFPDVGFVAGSYRVRRNVDAIRSRGIELDARWERGTTFALLSYARAAAYVRASGSAAPLDGLRPAQTPRDLLSTTVGWRRDRTLASATLRYTSAQFEDDRNTRRLGAATTLDLAAALPLTRVLVLDARIENAADATVAAGISGDGVRERAAPRTLWLGVRLRA